MNPILDLAGNPAGLQALLGMLDRPHVLLGVYDPSDCLDFANETFRHAFQLDDAPRGMTFADVILHGVIKSINDRYGHAAGDAVLRDFAEICRVALRQSDLLGRIGGEEFLLVFPNTSFDDAVAAVERIRGSLAERVVPIEGYAPIGYSFSCGVCNVESTDDVNSALARADRALYAAKHAGRNRVVTRRAG